jgi:hypothetical protein
MGKEIIMMMGVHGQMDAASQNGRSHVKTRPGPGQDRAETEPDPNHNFIKAGPRRGAVAIQLEGHAWLWLATRPKDLASSLVERVVFKQPQGHGWLWLVSSSGRPWPPMLGSWGQNGDPLGPEWESLVGLSV